VTDPIETAWRSSCPPWATVAVLASENSSFHVVGTIFDAIFKEGSYVLRPGAGTGDSQALDLQPSQGGFVEFTLDEAGLYPRRRPPGTSEG
jgi:hypothetical protein